VRGEKKGQGQEQAQAGHKILCHQASTVAHASSKLAQEEGRNIVLVKLPATEIIDNFTGLAIFNLFFIEFVRPLLNMNGLSSYGTGYEC
jgi:hypothetical protein